MIPFLLEEHVCVFLEKNLKKLAGVISEVLDYQELLLELLLICEMFDYFTRARYYFP